MSNKITYANGTSEWSNSQGIRHRINGPALHYASGTKIWLINGKRHNLNGPAIQYSNGSKIRLINGKPHNINGPASHYTDGSKSWLINGTQYSQFKYNKILKISPAP